MTRDHVQAREDSARRIAEIRALRAEGTPVRAIADHFGVSRARLYQLLSTELMTAEEQAARQRFPMFTSDLAVRLARRFSDDDAVCAAKDREVLNLRRIGPTQLQKLRARYPHRPQAGAEDHVDQSEDQRG